MYNAFLKTTPRTGRKVFTESSAGSAKAPSGGAKNRDELRALGQRMNWDATRSLTLRDLQSMASDEYLFMEVFNPNFQKVFETQNNIAHNKEVDKQMDGKKFWKTFDGQEKYAKDFERFVSRYPQYVGKHATENNAALLGWLEERNLVPSFDNLVTAFDACALEGRLWINPSAASAGSDVEISGPTLTQHKNFHLMLQPQRPVSAVDRVSADQYLAEHKELHDTRVPPMVMEGWRRLLATFAGMRPEFVDSAAAREKLLEGVRARKMNVTIQALEEVFQQMVKSGELQADKSKTVQAGATRLVDLGGR